MNPCTRAMRVSSGVQVAQSWLVLAGWLAGWLAGGTGHANNSDWGSYGYVDAGRKGSDTIDAQQMGIRMLGSVAELGPLSKHIDR